MDYETLFNEIMGRLPELIQQAMNESATDDVVIDDMNSRMNEDYTDAGKEPPYLTHDINGEHEVINLRENPYTSIIYNEEATQKERLAFNKWLRQHREDYVRLYHGTDADIPIMKDGLKRTTTRTKKSMQSAPGFVYLSIYPQSARTFGELAYPRKQVTVYAVDIKIKELLPDKDQLYNKRLYGQFDVDDTLADSLIFGHGARVKRNILPYELSKTDF